jgi:glyoxylase-like metal-dependent hydrolase (beta-lactamase superfamily II)
VPGRTRGSVVYLLDDRVLFAGDSLAWNMSEQDLVAFRDACWYSWSALIASLAKLADYRFEWLLPGHGWPAHLPAEEMGCTATRARRTDATRLMPVRALASF